MGLGWLWGASGLRGTGSLGARVALVARVAKVARVTRVARGLIILWFSWLYGLIEEMSPGRRRRRKILKDLY